MLTQVKMNEFNKAFKITANTVAKDTAVQFQMQDKHWKYLITFTCTVAGNLTFTSGGSALAGADLVIPFEVGTNAVTVEDALVKSMKPITISNVSYLDVVTLTSSQALTDVRIIKLP